MKFPYPIFILLVLILPINTSADTASPQNPPASVQEEAEFDAGLLMPINGAQSIDVNRFRFGNPIPTGDYQADVFVNGVRRGQVLLQFVESKEQPIHGLCLNTALLNVLDVKAEAVHLQPASAQCVPAYQAIPQAQFAFDIGVQRLDVSIPAILLVQRPEGYIPPSQWQAGVPAAFLHYSLNQYQYRHDDAHQGYGYLGIRAGANLGKWSLRHSGSQTWQRHQREAYHGQETYLQRDIDALNSRLTLGDFQTGGDLLDYFGIRGVALASDTRMLPESLSHYAPSIRGVANSNARVVVRQNGQIIHETTVPAGLFVIDDLPQASLGSDLQVEIMEDNGLRREFSVPVARSGQMLRPKQWTYSVAAGRYRDYQRVYPVNVWQGMAQYGLSNRVTLKSGLTATPHYFSGTLGALWDFGGNSVETDVQAAWLKQPQQRQAQSLRVAYNRYFAPTQTYLYFNWYRHFSPNHFDLRDAVLVNADGYRFDHESPYRNRYQISLNQRLGKHAGTMYLSGSVTDHRQKHRQNEYQLGYSNVFKQLQYNIVFSQSRRVDSDKVDKQVYVNFSLPLFERQGLDRTWLTAAHQHSYRDKVNTTQATLSGMLGKDNQLNYSATTSQTQGRRGYSLASSYHAPFAAVNVSGAKNGSDTQWSYGLSGSVVAHPYGVTFGRDLGETFTIVRAKDAAGALIRNHANLHLDRWGNGIVPNVTPYRVNHIGIAPDRVPDDVEMTATEKEIVPRANTVTLVQLETNKGYPVLFQLRADNGEVLPPLSAEAWDEAGKVVGYVVQGGQLFVHLHAPEGWLKVVWGNREAEQCYIQYALQAAQLHTASLIHEDAVCEMRLFPVAQ